MSLRNFLTFIREASVSHLAGIVPILPVVGAAVASIGFFMLGNWLVALIIGLNAAFLSVLFAGAIHFVRWIKHRSDLSCLIAVPKAKRQEIGMLSKKSFASLPTRKKCTDFDVCDSDNRNVGQKP